jgi:amino acid transporter
MLANDYEKQQYAVTGDSPSDQAIKELAHQKGDHIAEAANIYGSVEEAESYGYVHRGLKSRHIQFIALGGTIGTGLFLGIGGAFANAGPVSVLLGYSITGLSVFAMMQCLGEMATWLPLPGAIPQYCSRYTDPALGFAVGWNTWYQNAITLCAEISAAALLINFWDQEGK